MQKIELLQFSLCIVKYFFLLKMRVRLHITLKEVLLKCAGMHSLHFMH